MQSVTPRQVAGREQVEALIALAAPFLDLVLAVGDRISRLAGHSDEYYPIRASTGASELEAPPDPT